VIDRKGATERVYADVEFIRDYQYGRGQNTRSLMLDHTGISSLSMNDSWVSSYSLKRYVER
jgi:hypothetical protein